MERLNLNVTRETRDSLRRLARRRSRKEAELARELLARALKEAEREEFFREMEQNMTGEARRRLNALAVSLEKLRGRSG